MTEKLYDQNSMLLEFTAEVLEYVNRDKKHEVVLDRTAFFPEGGGQSADTGWLFAKSEAGNAGKGLVQVLDVQEEKGIIYHQVTDALPKGRKVTGKLNFEERFSKMQQHSGEHIVSGLAHSLYGCRNVGFHLGMDIVTMDYDLELTLEQLRKIEWEANQAVAKNIPIQILYPTDGELGEMAYRSKMEIEGQVRIVRIQGYDTCACCAPHVKRTGSIGIIKLTGFIRYKGGVRVTMVCGLRALQDYNRKEENILEIAGRLSVPPIEASMAVLRLEKEILNLKEKIKRLAWQHVEDKLMQIANTDRTAFLFEEELDMAVMRKFVNDGMKQTQGICGVFVGNDETGYQYVLGSENQDILDIAGELNRQCQGKGGGKPPMVQGHLKGGKKEIEVVLNRLKKECE